MDIAFGNHIGNSTGFDTWSTVSLSKKKTSAQFLDNNADILTCLDDPS